VIDGMTLAEAGEIFDYWADHPPMHLMTQAIARMLGWKPAPDTTPSPYDIAAAPPPGLAIAPGGDIGMPAPVLDIDELRRRNRERLSTGRRNL